jgi:hypothetical protein
VYLSTELRRNRKLTWKVRQEFILAPGYSVSCTAPVFTKLTGAQQVVQAVRVPNVIEIGRKKIKIRGKIVRVVLSKVWLHETELLDFIM